MSNEKDRARSLAELLHIAEDAAEKDDLLNDRAFGSIVAAALKEGAVTADMLADWFCVQWSDVHAWAHGRIKNMPPSCRKSDVMQIVAWYIEEMLNV